MIDENSAPPQKNLDNWVTTSNQILTQKKPARIQDIQSRMAKTEKKVFLYKVTKMVEESPKLK